MISIYNRIINHPKSEKVIHWGKLISITGTAQIIIQLSGFICGILIIRLLPIKEYALYTLANTMLGTMVILADGGISIGVMAESGKVWNEKKKLGSVLATGLLLRKKFALRSLIISLPILLYLLLHNGASVVTSILITLSVIPAFYAALSDTLLEIIPKLHQAILPLQKNQVIVSIIRLTLIGLSMFIFPWTFIIILSGGISRIYGNCRLKKIVYTYVAETHILDPQNEKDILKTVKKVLPGALYFCVSSQINVWLISFLGNTTVVAQIGALGRLAMLLNILGILINTLILPKFVKLPNNKKQLLKYILISISVVTVVCIIIIAFSKIFPNQILFILGRSYSDLSQELVLSILIGCLNLIIGIFISFSSSRGWIMNPIFLMIINILGTIVPIYFVNISTLNGILLLSFYGSIWGLLVFGTYTLLKIMSIDNALLKPKFS